MTPRGQITRRRFIRIITLLMPLGLVRFPPALATFFSPTPSDPIVSNLTKIIINKKSSGIVGRAYLRSTPEEADARLLVDLICSSQAGLRSLMVGKEPEQLRTLIRHLQMEDFENGRTARVQGWVLSRTEARLCALVALS